MTTTRNMTIGSDAPTMMSSSTDISRNRLVDLATAVATDGASEHEEELLGVAVLAASFGVSPVLLGILGDGGAPDVVRARALARVAQQVERLSEISAQAASSANGDGRDALADHGFRMAARLIR